MSRDSAIFYRSFYEAIDNLPSKSQKEQVYSAIFDFVFKNIEPNLKLDGGKPGEPRVVKGEILLRSASENGIKGKTIVDAPEGWAVRKGGVQNFSIYQSRGLARIRVELIVPAEFTGLVPLPIRVQVGEREIEKIAFIVIK